MFQLYENVLPSYLLNAVVNQWPGKDRADIWHYYNTAAQRKFASKVCADTLGNPFSYAMHEMAGKINYSPTGTALIGIGAFPDFRLYASGLMWMTRGDFIAEHTDAARHAFLELIRVASTVLYLTGGTIHIDGHAVDALPNSMIVFDPGIKHEVKPIEDIDRDRLTLNLFWWRRMTLEEKIDCNMLDKLPSSSQFGKG